MLVTFKSKAAADVMMYEQHAKQILDLFQKDVKRGIFTAAELPGAIATLEREIQDHKQHAASDAVVHDVVAHHGAQGDDHGHESQEAVGFASRAFPFLEMLRATQTAGNNVVWGD